MSKNNIGTGKVFISKQDMGKMLRLKDINNLIIKGVKFGNDNVEIFVETPINNKTNNRIKSKELNYNSVYQDKEKIESIVCRDGHSSSYIINKDKIEFKVE